MANLSLMKKFYFQENRYLQFRWEAFNAFNHVNLHDPNTTIGQGSTGQIFSAGDARSNADSAQISFLSLSVTSLGICLVSEYIRQDF